MQANNPNPIALAFERGDYEGVSYAYFDLVDKTSSAGIKEWRILTAPFESAKESDLSKPEYDDIAESWDEVSTWCLKLSDIPTCWYSTAAIAQYDASGKLQYRQIAGPEDDAPKLERAMRPFVSPAPTKAQILPTVFPSDWVYKSVPDREWWLPDLVPSRTVTLLSGDGGVGKSLLALQLGAACAMGITTAGLTPRPGRVMYLGAEDEQDEFHRRLVDIAEAHRRTLADLEDRFMLMPMAGLDATLSAPDRDERMTPTKVWERLDSCARQFLPDILILDTSADLFAGNENIRAQVRQFVGMLRSFAQEHDCAVLLLSHPSLTGISSGSGLSGSTAWNNSVRSRLYLEWACCRADEDPDRFARRLSTKKVNYGDTGSAISLRWQDGCFISESPAAGFAETLAAKHAEDVFLALLAKTDRRGQRLSPSSGANHAPHVMSKLPKARGISKRALEAAMHRPQDSGTIEVVTEGPQSRQTKRLILARVG
jgi:RecA-family ATPase